MIHPARALPALLLALVLQAAPAAAAEAPLRFRLNADPATLDWSLATTSAETHVIMNIMQGLVEEGPDLKPRPALAERWEVSPDGLTYTFFLRPGVKWSDGRPLKAQDFADSWLRLLSPRTQSDYSSFLFDIEGAQDYREGRLKDASKVGFKALDDSRFQVRLRNRVPHFLHLPTFWVTFPIRSDLIAKHGSAWATAGKLATLGPYRLKSWSKGKALGLERNPSYFGEAPSVGRAELVVEPDEKRARKLFADGKLDFLLDATTDDLLKARSGAMKGRVEQFPYLVTYYLGFNTRKFALKDASVRKALASVVDRDAIPSELQGGQQVASSFVPPGLEGYAPPAFQPASLYDARGALERAGFPEGRGFPRLSLWLGGFDRAEALGALIAKSLSTRLGIAVDVKVTDFGQVRKAVAEGRADLFVRLWGADFPEPSNFLGVFVSGSGTNHAAWSSAEYDRQMRAAREAADPAARNEAYAKAETLLLQEAPILPLFRRRNTVLVGPRVEKLSISPLNYLFLEDVSLKKE